MCSTPYIFNLFAEALHWILDRNLAARIRHYLDHFLQIKPPDSSPEDVQHVLDWSLALGQQLGLTFQPTTQLTFLGLELDSIAMEARLPSEKLHYLRELLDSWQTRSHCTLRELQELTGFLQFGSQVVPTSRTFLHGLFDFANEFSRRRVPGFARRDIDWWSKFAFAWNGVRLLTPERETIHIFTDASGTKGIGGYFGSQWYSIHCPRRLRGEHIQVKEMYTVIYAVLCWGEQLRGKCIVFHIDNEATQTAVEDFTIRSAPTMKLVQDLLVLAWSLDYTFSSVWLASKENVIADAASRFSTRMGRPSPTPLWRAALLAASLKPNDFAGHSFRQGAASSAATAGYSDYEIQMLGRWRSDAYKLYIDVDQCRLLQLSNLLHWVHPHSGPYEPPVLPPSSFMA